MINIWLDSPEKTLSEIVELEEETVSDIDLYEKKIKNAQSAANKEGVISNLFLTLSVGPFWLLLDSVKNTRSDILIVFLAALFLYLFYLFFRHYSNLNEYNSESRMLSSKKNSLWTP